MKKTNLRLIRKLVQPIVEGFHPQKIVLFGSYAYGRTGKDSDVDLLVVMRSRKRPVERAIEVSKSLRFYPFPMDILVRTPQEIRSNPLFFGPKSGRYSRGMGLLERGCPVFS